MKYLKMLGLAAIAAAALMAFIGAGTASATVICKTEPVGGACPEGWSYAAGTKGKASLEGTAALESLTGTVLDTCTESIVESSIENAGGATATVESALSTLTLGNCTKTTDVISPGSAELHWIPETNNGTLTTRNTSVTVNTIFGTCTYGTGSALDMGTVVGGTGSLTINALVPKIAGSAICPPETRFTGKYVATEPKTAWVAER